LARQPTSTIRGAGKAGAYRQQAVAQPSSSARQPVPWRTIWATIASVALVYVGYQAFLATARVITYLVVAIFFAIVLNPAVDFLQHKLHFRRGIATAVVMLTGLGLLAGMIYAFVKPIAEQASTFSSDLPTYVEEARNGQGPVGDLVKRYNLEQKIKDNQPKIQEAVSNFGQSGLTIVQRVFTTIVAGITVMVLTVLILLEAPSLSSGLLSLIPDEKLRNRVQRVSTDAAKAVSGYVFGNLLISLIAGVATWIALLIVGVPYAATLGLFVGFADLIPLIGATLGAIPTILFAFLHSVPAGITMTIFYIVYQQFENHVLQVTIMSRTVKLNPLAVLISVLVGVELFGFLGALLAIPAGGIIQVIARDIYDERRGRLKAEPTVGADEVPIASAGDDSTS
jgi:sporulation integral membrane protein YtvI